MLTLTPKHKCSLMEWSRKCMKTDMKLALFTDESKATIEGPDCWA